MKTITPTKKSPQETTDTTDVTQILHHDHQEVAELFFQYSELEESDLASKNKIAKAIVQELFIHAKIEEEIVYPSVRKLDKDSEKLMDEADTEHHLVKFILAELSEMKAGDDHFDSKICVLGELVNHHVQEEEKEIFEALREGDFDLQKMGAQILARKKELGQTVVPKGMMIMTDSKSAPKSKK